MTTFYMLQRFNVIEINETQEKLNDYVYKALMNNDLGMMKTLMAKNMKLDNPLQFLHIDYEYEEKLANLNSKKLFKNIGNKNTGKKFNIWQKFDIKKLLSKDSVLDIFKNINIASTEFRPQSFQSFANYKQGIKRNTIQMSRI